jgi:hypothetical protein
MRSTPVARPLTRLRAACAPCGAMSSVLRLSSAAARLPSLADVGEWARRAARTIDGDINTTPAAT